MIFRRDFLAVITAISLGTACRTSGFAGKHHIGSAELLEYDAVGLAELIRQKHISAKELIAVFKARAETINPIINCIATATFERAFNMADDFSDSQPFAGVPFMFKDMVDVQGIRRTDGSRLLEASIPNESVEYTKAMQASGLNIIASTVTPEFAAGLESELFGQTKNPWNLQYSCLLSSSGSAAAVSSGIVPLAHGTDGGGSNRLPSNATHVFGFKPSRYRMLSGEPDGMHDPFKTNGPISRSVRDAALLIAATEDRHNEYYPPIGYVGGPGKRRLKIAYAREGIGGYPVEASIKACQDHMAKMLQEMGHTVEEIIHPVDGREYYERFIHAYMPKWLPVLDHVKQLSGKSPRESGLLSLFTITMIESAKQYTPEQQRAAQRYLSKVGEMYYRVYNRYDVILSAVTPVETPLLGAVRPEHHWSDKSGLLKEILSLTAPVNGAGDCAMSVPAGFSAKTQLPVGSMFSARAGHDALLLQLAYELELSAPWANQWAPYSAKYLM